MIIRNGINSILRERGRTALFSILIVFLTVTMILSLSVLMYCNAMMAACEEEYRSIALLEYMGTEYPNEDEPDVQARSAAEELTDEAVLSIPGVAAWTRANTSYGFVEGYDRRTAGTPYGNKSVIIVSNLSNIVYQGAGRDLNDNPVILEETVTYYTANYVSALYVQKDRTGKILDILAGDTGFAPEKGKTYVLNGSFVDTNRMERSLGIQPMNGMDIFRVESFFESGDTPYLEYTGDETIPQVFHDAADQYRFMNNYVRVVPCRDVDDVYIFQQNDLQLSEGTMPDPDTPYSCVVSQDFAQCLGLKPGDSFTLDTLKGAENDRYYLKPAEGSKTYTVSGIANKSATYYGVVWAIDEDADDPLFGYTIGTASLKNAEAEEAVDALRAIVPGQVRVTLLDQGYSNAVEPFQEVKKTSSNVLIVSSGAVAAVLLLFAFLFVGRQNATVKIMVSLGTPGHKIAQWFLSGALLICGASAFIGTVIGTFLRPAAISIVSQLASVARGKDGFLWYSETSVGVIKDMAFDLKIPFWPSIVVMLAIVAVAVIFCMLFLRLARKSGTRKKGKSRVYVPHGTTSSHLRGGLRFALLSIRRGGLRTLLVPLVAMVLTVTVIVLGGVYQGWQNELDEVLDNSEIDGMIVSLDGRYYSDLALTTYAFRTLQEVEGISDVSVSYGFNYWLDEEMPYFSNGESGRERRQAWIENQPELVTVNALAAAKDFYYSDPQVTWLEGWDETMLMSDDVKPMYLRSDTVPVQKPVPGVFSSKFLEDHGMVLGDTLLCLTQSDDTEYPIILQAVGSYVQAGGKAHIYVPIALYDPPAILYGGEIPDEIVPYGVYKEWFYNAMSKLTFRTCRFHLEIGRAHV